VTGFVTVALTFLATKHGLSIKEAALLPAASLLSQWLKWLWAPAVDATLTPKRWLLDRHRGVGARSAGAGGDPMTEDTLPLLVAVVAISSLLRTFVGMRSSRWSPRSPRRAIRVGSARGSRSATSGAPAWAAASG